MLLHSPQKAASFISIWYYIEILFMMNIAIFFYHPIIISIVGVMLGLLLSVHIIKLYTGNAINYYVQLIIMDVHIAYSIGMTIAALLSDVTWYFAAFSIARVCIACIEMLLVYYMTSDN